MSVGSSSLQSTDPCRERAERSEQTFTRGTTGVGRAAGIVSTGVSYRLVFHRNRGCSAFIVEEDLPRRTYRSIAATNSEYLAQRTQRPQRKEIDFRTWRPLRAWREAYPSLRLLSSV